MMRLIALLVSFAGIHGPAMAENSFYIGASLGQSSVDDRADADGASFPAPGFPESLSIDGMPFDSKETAWGAFLGWHAKSWLSIEAAYRDLGNFASALNLPVFVGPPPNTSPSLPSPPPNPPPAVSFVPFIPPVAAMDVREWSLGARFNLPVSSRVTANWFVGISRADFETQGSFRFATVPDFPFGPIELVSVPFRTPDDQTGYVAGFGFTFDVTGDIGFDLGYRRHDTGVVEIDRISLDLIWSFQAL